ncbi:hypothetical protein [Roseateles chitinivorans]|uniref:hypothetical protein n=1 Tax=Roseateles chitinivorans TaxID=2917965 RepID=UPI003D672A8E
MTNPLDWLLLRAAARRLRRRRADFYYDLASALEDRVPLYTILRKLEARARRRSRGDQLLYRQMLRARRWAARWRVRCRASCRRPSCS